MYVLDTNAVSDLFKQNVRILARVRAATDAGRRVVTSLVTRIEILRGRFEAVIKAANRAEVLVAVRRLAADEERLAGMVVLPIDEPVADQFERLLADKKARKAGRDDLLIACIALAHHATLVTRNTTDFAAVPGLRVENWAD